MPPTGVLMSTCLSCPSFSFLTFTLQAGKSRVVRAARARANGNADGNLLRMRGTSVGGLCRALDAGAALGDVRNGDGEMAAHRNLAEQGFDGGDFRNRGVGEGTHVIFDPGKIAGQVGISH